MKITKFIRGWSLSLVVAVALSGCGIQSIPTSENGVEAAWAEVVNQYKRRADLVPNLVSTVQGFAKQEKEVLIGVTEARARATSVNVDPTHLNEQTLHQFQESQRQLGGALSRLMVVAEKYPELRSNENFRDLQAQLEGTENRITIARQRYIQAVNEFNNLVTVPPTSWTNSLMLHKQKKPQFTVENESQVKEPPKVQF